MGPFASSYGHKYVLVGMEYVSKWVEAIVALTNKGSLVLNFLQGMIFIVFQYSKSYY